MSLLLRSWLWLSSISGIKLAFRKSASSSIVLDFFIGVVELLSGLAIVLVGIKVNVANSGLMNEVCNFLEVVVLLGVEDGVDEVTVLVVELVDLVLTDLDNVLDCLLHIHIRLLDVDHFFDTHVLQLSFEVFDFLLSFFPELGHLSQV